MNVVLHIVAPYLPAPAFRPRVLVFVWLAVVSCNKQQLSNERVDPTASEASVDDLVVTLSDSTDAEGTPIASKGYLPGPAIEGGKALEVADLASDAAKEQKIFEYEKTEGVDTEFTTEPSMVSGSFLAGNSAGASECALKSYQTSEPTVSDVLRYSRDNKKCGVQSFNFCIRVTLAKSGASTYLKTPPLKVSLPCPEETFASLGVTIGDGAVPTSATTTTLKFTASALVKAMYVTTVSDCSSGGEWEAFAPAKAGWALGSKNAENHAYARFRDVVGNESSCLKASVVHDDVAPTGASISINGGAAFTNSLAVNLALNAEGATTMMINHGSTCNPETAVSAPYTATKSWTLAQANVSQSVAVVFRDEAGNESPCVSATIAHDTMPPPAGLIINAASTHTSSTNVTLTLAGGDADQMYLTNTPGCASGGSWAPYQASTAWLLLQTNTTATVYAKFRDSALNESSCVSADIIHDNVLPSAASISISSGATYTISSSVTVGLAASGATQMYVTGIADCSSGGTWEAYATTKAGVSLPDSNTTVTLSAKFRDDAGNESSCVSDTIVHDNTAPSQPSSFSDGDSSVGSNRTDLMSWAASTDAGSGFDHYIVALGTSAGDNDVMDWTDIGTVTSRVFSGLTLTLGTTYYASIRAVDTAGNMSDAVDGDGFVTRVGWAQEAYLKTTLNKFGHPSLEGDTLAAPRATNSVDAAVNIFQRTGTTWALQDTVQSSNHEAADGFGDVLSLSGTTLIVAAEGEDSNETTITMGTSASADNTNTNSGAAYIFERSGTSWAQTAYIKPAVNYANLLFADGVAIDGNTIAIGAQGDVSSQLTISAAPDAAPSGRSYSGAVHIFNRSGASWVQEAYLKASNAGASDFFGTTVQLSGNTLAVSAFGEDSNETTITNGTTASADNTFTESGAVYIFERTGTAWAQQAYIKPATNTDDVFYFGDATSLSGDTLVVGASSEDSTGTTIVHGPTVSTATSTDSTNTGAVFVYKRTGTTWAQEAYLKASNAGFYDYFGEFVDLKDNLLVVGAIGEKSNQTTITNGTGASSNNDMNWSGAAYVFKRTGSTWEQEAYLKPVNNRGSIQYAQGVTIYDDTIAVAANGEASAETTIINGSTASSDVSVPFTGAIYIYKRHP